ncbi:MAG: hypothetical protein ACR2M7_00575 [Bdellovibrionales bacterium]
MKYLLVFLLSITGCTSMTKVTYLKKGVKSFYMDGVEYIFSKKSNSEVILKAKHHIRSNEKRVYLWVNVKNLSNEIQTIDLKNITILRKSKRDKLYVNSYDDLIKEVNKSKRNYMILAILGGVAQGMSSGRSYHSGSVRSSSGNSYSYSGSSYNSNLAKIENREYARNVGSNMRYYDNQKRNYKETILKKNTLFPNKEVSGWIAVDWPGLETEKDFFIILIKFAGDQHKFYLKQFNEA